MPVAPDFRLDDVYSPREIRRAILVLKLVSLFFLDWAYCKIVAITVAFYANASARHNHSSYLMTFLKMKCGLLRTTRFRSLYDFIAPVGSILKQLSWTCGQSRGSGCLLAIQVGRDVRQR